MEVVQLPGMCETLGLIPSTPPTPNPPPKKKQNTKEKKKEEKEKVVEVRGEENNL